MTERRKLKKELSKLKSYRKCLPRLIDCSNVYGDDYFNNEQYVMVDKDIKKIEDKIIEIDKLNEVKC